MKVKLREGLVRDLFDEWLKPGRAYRLTSASSSNPPTTDFCRLYGEMRASQKILFWCHPRRGEIHIAFRHSSQFFVRAPLFFECLLKGFGNVIESQSPCSVRSCPGSNFIRPGQRRDAS
jgi:hypothetical protein